MKIVFFTAIVLGLIVIVWGQLPVQLPENKMVDTEKGQAKCSSDAEGFQFCTNTPHISANSGENVAIQVVLKNTTKKPVTIVRSSFNEMYNIKVMDSKGGTVRSIEEMQADKIKSNADNEQVLELPLNSSPQKVQLAPQQELRTEYNLSNFYDLKAKGKYQIEISRKIPKLNGIGFVELSFGAIEVEIK